MPVFLKALALRNYRGIGGATQKMPNFKTFNFFIGANNTGKSTVLNFISKHLPFNINQGRILSASKHLDPLEQHDGKNAMVYAGFGFTIQEAIHELHLKYPNEMKNGDMAGAASTVITAISDSMGMIWKGGSVPVNQLSLPDYDPKSLQKILHPNNWQRLWSQLTRQQSGDLLQHWVPATISKISDALDVSLPTTRLIPAIRQIGPNSSAFEDFSGSGLINQLAALQNPEHDRRTDRLRFDRINGFLRTVTGKSDAEIEIPFSREHVLVHMDGRVLPLASLGTGIHEVIMIAAFCTIAENEIVCIEEPELHLHPLLQRKLVAYLAVETTNQYFIATHSPAFIDTPDAAIFHVTQQNSTTHISEAVLRQERFRICVDLGHRASDIVQSNAVIWVEGPSDRIYINHWLGIADPSLVESIHYSIMFYGGRLLSHLSANDDDVSEFIQLRSLNRNVAIVIDSDKASAHKPLNATKERLKTEFAKGGGIAWITKGREIENYIEHDRLQRAVKTVAGSTYGKAVSGGQFDHALFFERLGPKRTKKPIIATDPIERDIDKVKVSRLVTVDGMGDLHVLDLRERISALVKMIQTANG